MTDASAPGPSSADRWRLLVEAVLAGRADPAATAFEAELDRARTDGRVDAATARSLLWWHRAAVREVADQAADALPDAIAAVERARAESVAEAARAERAWAQASSGAPHGRSMVVGLTVLGNGDAGSAAPDDGSA